MHQRCTAGDTSEMYHGGGYYENSALRRSASGFEDDGETDEGTLNGTEIGKMLISKLTARLRYEHYSFINLNF